MDHLVAGSAKPTNEVLKFWIVRERRHIFHHDHLWPQLDCKTREIVNQAVSRIIRWRLSVFGSHCREALAGRTPCQEIQLTFYQVSLRKQML